MPYLQNATTFLVGALLSLALYTVLLRFWMQWVRADFRNEIGQFVISMTNPLVVPLRRILPSIGVIDTATVLLTILISTLKFYVIYLIAGRISDVFMIVDIVDPSILKVISLGFAGTIEATIYLFMATIFIGIIASWINPHGYHPILSIARSISEPLLAPARNLIPSLGGLDFSPMIVLLFLQFSLRLIVAPLYNLPL